MSGSHYFQVVLDKINRHQDLIHIDNMVDGK